MKSYSQYGEDTLTATRLVQEYGVAVEIGAGDGWHLSNTALFRERGWMNILVESDPRYGSELYKLNELPNVSVFQRAATPQNINRLVPDITNLLSIDVDGDDIFLLEALEHRPEIIIVEYNPTMPEFLDVMPSKLGLRIGASIKALKRVASKMDYGVVGITPCNVVFERGYEDANVFGSPPEYVVATEYFTGRPLVLGEAPWGVDFSNPYPPENVVVR